MSARPYGSIALVCGGVIVGGLGPYFVFMRPPLLPEDPRFMGASLADIEATLPGLSAWLRRVFDGWLRSTS